MTGATRIVHYSMSFAAADDPTTLLTQVEHSVSSLRRYNRDTDVMIFAYDAVPERLAQMCHRHGVELCFRGSYARRLEELCPVGWPVLSRYPVLHKFLNFGALAGTDAGQALYCDCDTVFRADVDRLFDACTEADLYAREEVHSGRSRYGPDPAFLDEHLLQVVAHSLGVVAVPPFNTGAVLLNHRVWEVLGTLDKWFLDCAWHLLVWISLHPEHTAGSGYGTLDAVESARELAIPDQLARALPFPSANQWILEEVAAWLTLGAVPWLTTADFSPADVVQNGEFTGSRPHRSDWTLCHYFSNNLNAVAAWLTGPPAGPSPVGARNGQ